MSLRDKKYAYTGQPTVKNELLFQGSNIRINPKISAKGWRIVKTAYDDGRYHLACWAFRWGHAQGYCQSGRPRRELRQPMHSGNALFS